ncbi:mitochondrial potassium channel ATP-binding subunit [Anthonomus grandis grandis]|uniref:mitochondrial potassium channel ATP-binding subunit n=1 Tax=Anthonomus grandis grandis TaxID=2921223 RepID=UPI002165908B|nr:mitochondrial potassium channel ATP-binding subunit [Anthonomus grandis grandis]
MLWRLALHPRLTGPQLLKGSNSFVNPLKFLKNYPEHVIRTYPTKCARANYSKPLLKLHVILAGCGALTLKLSIDKNVALCGGQNSRLVGYRSTNTKNLHFDWRKFWEYLKPHIWSFLVAIMGALAVALLNIQIPQIMGEVINVLARFSNEHDSKLFINEMRLPAMKLIAMYIGQSFFTFFYISMLSNLGEKIAFKMKTDLFASILKQDIAFFDAQRTGEIVTRLTADIQDFKSSFKQTISGGLRAATQIIGCTVSLFIISPYMTLISLLCIPSVIGIGTVFGSILRVTSRKAQAQVEKTTAVADEAISNIRTVRAFAMEEQERSMFVKEAEKAMNLNETLGFGIGVFQAGTNLFLNGTVLMTLYMGGYLLSTNQLSAGEVMSFLMASQTIQRSLAQVSLLFGSVIKGLAAGGRVFEYINMEPTMRLTGGKILPSHLLKGNIEFRNVTFAYPTRKQQVILENFNLSVEAGKTIAIVGASGNGKSTIVALLERFYDVDKGTVLVDGHDIRTLDPSWFRRKVLGLISQEPVLFGTSIMENIRYGKPEATDEEVMKAAKLANADDFISSFPKGYRTMVGERGATLSGGQKQRIAIARALLKDPKILLLDEATSALDAESEKIVQAALDNARKGRTVIVIAHRLSTVRNADLILVLDEGKIVEMGTHAQLQKLKGYYWALTFQQHHQHPEAA